MAKKKQKCAEKHKEFINTPFRGLKAIVADTELAPAKEETVGKTPEPVREEVDERELFLRAVQGAEKLKATSSGHGSAGKPVAEPRIKEEDRQLFISSLKGMDSTFQDEYPEDESLRPLAVNRMRQLKNGAIRIDLELDLHGLTRDEALASLSRFVTGAYNRGQKAILVITGKGNNSPGEPVLQSAVASWLRESGKKMVAEFAPAPRQMGGSGAFVVFLKDNKDK
ncbi:MAG: Smr/MutS family protein [Geobacteraceae bacterium]|nr:Smr/MutS family protein [Geobacteraceae bacterium]